jgi:hypothetical protein
MGVDVLEVKLFKALVNSDASSNGGRESYNEIISGLMNNLFPNISHAERVAGKIRYRKMFLHNTDDEQFWLFNSRFWIDKISTAEDYFRIATGTPTDTQADVAGYDFVGTGRLTEVRTAGQSQVKVNFGDTDLVGVIGIGDPLYITNLKSIDDTGHYDEFNEIAGISWAGSVATIDLVDPLQHSYPISYDDGGATYYTRIGVYLALGDLYGYADGHVVTSGAGTYASGLHPVEGDNESSVEDSITVTFTSTTAFTVAGTYLGSLGAGNISSDFAPTNPSTGRPYFTIPKEGWGGTWAPGDTLEFDTHPASAAIWVKEVVPAGAEAFSNNVVEVAFYGESGPQPSTTTTTTTTAPPTTTTTTITTTSTTTTTITTTSTTTTT